MPMMYLSDANTWETAESIAQYAAPSVALSDQAIGTTSIPTGKSAIMDGPITIAQGQTLTIAGTGKIRIL